MSQKNFLELDVILLSKGLNTVDDKEDWFFFGRKVFKSCSNNWIAITDSSQGSKYWIWAYRGKGFMGCLISRSNHYFSYDLGYAICPIWYGIWLILQFANDLDQIAYFEVIHCVQHVSIKLITRWTKIFICPLEI